MKNKQLLAWILFWLVTTPVAVAMSASLMDKSNQLVLVLTPDWNSVDGKLQRYQRDSNQKPWIKIGEPVAVVVGQQGMAWGVDSQKSDRKGPFKKEGDGRTPVGVYEIGPVFGFDSTPTINKKMPYFPLTDTSICVDDEKSHYYNQLLDSSKILHPDWHSGEQMRTIPLYRFGSVVQYNTHRPIVGKGSCIFLHRWRGPGHGTAGCIAMDESPLRYLLAWLDPTQKPMIASFPESAYKDLREQWNLPITR